MLDQIDDTIVAISSPPGRSAVGIVRLTRILDGEICKGLAGLNTRKKIVRL